MLTSYRVDAAVIVLRWGADHAIADGPFELRRDSVGCRGLSDHAQGPTRIDRGPRRWRVTLITMGVPVPRLIGCSWC
jgi:hypothetical protein